VSPTELRAYLDVIPERVRSVRLTDQVNGWSLEVDLAAPEGVVRPPAQPEEYPGLSDLMQLPRGVS